MWEPRKRMVRAQPPPLGRRSCDANATTTVQKTLSIIFAGWWYRWFKRSPIKGLYLFNHKCSQNTFRRIAPSSLPHKAMLRLEKDKTAFYPKMVLGFLCPFRQPTFTEIAQTRDSFQVQKPIAIFQTPAVQPVQREQRSPMCDVLTVHNVDGVGNFKTTPKLWEILTNWLWDSILTEFMWIHQMLRKYYKISQSTAKCYKINY